MALDPGGNFETNEARRVLGHLSRPEDNFGYTPEALHARLVPDVASTLSQIEVEDYLDALVADGDAEVVQGNVYRQTVQGFEKLTGPAEVEAPVRPADPAAPTILIS